MDAVFAALSAGLALSCPLDTATIIIIVTVWPYSLVCGHFYSINLNLTQSTATTANTDPPVCPQWRWRHTVSFVQISDPAQTTGATFD